MHNFFAGFMGFFMGVTSLLHGGSTSAIMHHNNPAMQQATISGTPVPSGMPHDGKGSWNTMKLPAGEEPFFGTVTAVNGTTLTVQMMGMMMMHPPLMHNPHMTMTTTPSPMPTMAPKTITVDLNSSTTYTGGTASDIMMNTKIVGVGTSDSDGSITAVKVDINPTPPARPSGFPHQPQQPNSQ